MLKPKYVANLSAIENTFSQTFYWKYRVIILLSNICTEQSSWDCNTKSELIASLLLVSPVSVLQVSSLLSLANSLSLLLLLLLKWYDFS